MVLMILAGIWALKSLNYQLDPNEERAWVFVNVSWPAAGAEDVERLVTTPMEQAIENINGIEDLYSTTKNNSAYIEVHFEKGSDSSWALDSVKQAVVAGAQSASDHRASSYHAVQTYRTGRQHSTDGPGNCRGTDSHRPGNGKGTFGPGIGQGRISRAAEGGIGNRGEQHQAQGDEHQP